MIPVVNLRNKPWPAIHVYVGRTFAGFDAHPLANPFPITQDTEDCRQDILDRYRSWLWNRTNLHEELWQIWGDTEAGRFPLSCWCVPKLCHATVIAEEAWKRFGGGLIEP